MSMVEAEETATFLLERVRVRWGRLWDQGGRGEVLGCGAKGALGVLARRRVRGVPESVAAGLCAWSRGERAIDRIERVPAAEEVLELQTRGRRCVSLLSDAAALAHGDPRHPDGLTFALHDLCHAEKFLSPEHHLGQVGFFRAVSRGLGSAWFRELEGGLDRLWLSDRNYVISDMNGSAIFLFAMLKMKIKRAVRRHVGRLGHRARLPENRGPLDAEERAAFEEVLARLMEALGFPPDVREAAYLVSTRRDHPTPARRLLAHFEETGAKSRAQSPAPSGSRQNSRQRDVSAKA
jgi:hypothetical protein